MKLKDILNVLHESIELSSDKEIKEACKLIIEVQELRGAEIDCIYAAFKNGPLFDGDVPSKSGRDELISKGFMVKVVVKGKDGFNALTHKGAWAYRLLLKFKNCGEQ